jgi:hypothetical protein
MSKKIIGLTGFARVGKDTFQIRSKSLLRSISDNFVCHRYAFADSLKKECDDFLIKNIGISSFTESTSEKNVIRPFLVTYGTHLRRKMDPECWIKKVRPLVSSINSCPGKSDFIFVTDVRFRNEAEWIKSTGGEIINISREGYGPANIEEKEQSLLIAPLIDHEVFWPTFGDDNINECDHLILPILKKISA